MAPEQWSGTGVSQSSSVAGAPSQKKALIRYRMYNTIVVTKYYYNRARNFCLKKLIFTIFATYSERKFSAYLPPLYNHGRFFFFFILSR